jgi:hypothetical protein
VGTEISHSTVAVEVKQDEKFEQEAQRAVTLKETMLEQEAQAKGS